MAVEERVSTPFAVTQSAIAERRVPDAALLAVLVGLLAAGAVLRVYQIERQSLWLDEAFSIAIASDTLTYLVQMTAQDVHPPLYYVLLHYWIDIWGGTEWTARLLSVVFSLGVVAAAYVTGARMLGRHAGILAAGLLTIAPFQIEFAQEARMYALLALLATVSTYCLFQVYAGIGSAANGGSGRRRAAAGWLIGYIVVTSLMTYTQVHSAFVLAAHGTIVGVDLLTRRSAARPFTTRWVIAMTAVVACFLPWLAVFAAQVSHVQRGFWIPEPQWRDLGSAFFTYAGSAGLVAIMAPLAVVGVWKAGRAPAVAGTRLFLLAWLLCPIGIPLALSVMGSPIYLPKYTIAASVPFALLAGAGLAAIPGLVRWPAIAAVVVLTAHALDPLYHGSARKDDWRSLVRVLEARAEPGDTVLFYPFFTKIPYDFYQSRPDVIREPFPRMAEVATDPAVLAMLGDLIGDRERVWLVAMSFDERKPAIVAALAERFARLERTQAFHIDAYLFSRPVADP